MIPERRAESTSQAEAERIPPPSWSFEEDIARALFIVLGFVVLIEALFRAIAKDLWFDEILTLLVATQPRISGIWQLLTHGVDGHPPGVYLVERAIVSLGGNERIVLRLPSIAGFLCVLICMFVFIRRRTGGLVALISVSALLVTELYAPFAFEARSYGLMVACIAVALLCYERVDSKLGAALFGLSLAAACSFHFYGALAFFPFGLAEISLLIMERRFRPRVWLGFVFGALPYLAFWPILREQKLLYGAHFWATPTLWAFAKSLGETVHLATRFSLAIYVAVMVYLVYLAVVEGTEARGSTAAGSGFSMQDMILTLGFFALPIVTLAAAKIGSGGISGRYLTTSMLGSSLALSLILLRVRKPALVAVGIFVFVMFAFQEGAEWRYVFKPRQIKDPMDLPSQLSAKMNVPVVISNGLAFLPSWYHAGKELKSRLFFLADPQEQLAASESDTTTLLLLSLRDYVPVQVQSFSEFSPNHRQFLLYSNGDAQDIWPRWLVRHGYSVRAIFVYPPAKSSTEDNGDPPTPVLYLVNLDERM